MALDPNIILRGAQPLPPVDAAGQLARGAQTVGIFQQLRNEQEMAPLRQAVLQGQAAGQALANQQRQAQILEAARQRDLKGLASSYLQVKGAIDAGNYTEAADQLENTIMQKLQAGQTVADMSDTIQAMETLRSNDPEAIAAIKRQGMGVVEAAEAEGLIVTKAGREIAEPAKVREIKGLIELAKSDDPRVSEPAKVALGTKARVGESAAERIARTGQTGLIASSQAVIEGEKAAAKETAKLSAQLKLEPGVKSAVTTAVAQAKATVDALGEKKDNQIALQVYETAMGGLTESLGETLTGPVAGWLPALTANQQIADGAVAAMAPVLKQLFRAAGEGSFSDSDQKLLLDMVPTRKDKPEARVAKVQNIDAIVRAKLGGLQKPAAQTPALQVQQPAAPVRRRYNPATGEFE